MDKRLCEKIIQNFDFKTMEVLKEYTAYRMEVIHRSMETAKDVDEFRKLQGEARGLKVLEAIRDHAVAVVDRGG